MPSDRPTECRGDHKVALRRECHKMLLEHLDLATIDAAKLEEPSMRPKVLGALRRIVQQLDANAVITRNAYGALVLNAARAMFIDVDFGDDGRDGPAMQRVQQWTASRPELAVRVYRTHAGLRLLVTNHTFDPTSPETIQLLQEVGSDKLYIQLCKAQASFRARLTPKPWRVGIRPPTVRFPYENADAAAELKHWVGNYDMASRQAAVCKLIQTTGPAVVLDEIRGLLSYHDQVALGDRPLA